MELCNEVVEVLEPSSFAGRHFASRHIANEIQNVLQQLHVMVGLRFCRTRDDLTEQRQSSCVGEEENNPVSNIVSQIVCTFSSGV